MDARKNSGAAVASLVLGILGFLTMGLTSIPAIVFGRVGASRIRKSGSLKGGWLAIAGLITGYSGLGILAASGWVLFSLNKRSADAKISQARADFKSLESAMSR